jgi:hypothetical protein
VYLRLNTRLLLIRSKVSLAWDVYHLGYLLTAVLDPNGAGTGKMTFSDTFNTINYDGVVNLIIESGLKY